MESILGTTGIFIALGNPMRSLSTDAGDRMKVTIDRMQCVSCGSCWDACPVLFVQNEKDSFSQIVSAFQKDNDPAKSITLPDSISCARDAADLCPVTIITLIE